MAIRGSWYVLGMSLCFCTSAIAAAPVDCAALSHRIAMNASDYRPAMEGEVVGEGRAYFHDAPNEVCVRKGFVVAGDMLEVRKAMPGWAHVVYISADGRQIGGWLKQVRVRMNGVPGPLYTGELPADAATFVRRREECEHFLGEEPYDRERREYLAEAVRDTCEGGNRELRALRQKYRGDAAILHALSGYEDLAE